MTDPTDTPRGTGGMHTRMEHEWYIDAGGRTEGPLSDDELRARAAGGLLQPTDRVSTDRAQWVPAATVPGLTFSSPSARAPGSTVVPAAKPGRPLVETVVSGATHAPESGTAPEFSPLDSVPGYDLQGTLGTGACGVVFRAVQKKLNRVVALKTVRMAENTPPELLTRFDQEAVSLARLQHPNIVAVYDCGHIGGRAFFAMELLDGEDLDQRLERDGPLTERTAWLVARQTAAALDHAAKHGVIHRDVKPANLFLVPPPTGFPLPSGVPMVKVTDFGLALTQRGPDDSDPNQTAAGLIIGTPVYMAPEQFRGGPVDTRADIYSLGVTVYHVLTGGVPFDGRTLLDVMAQKTGPTLRLPAPFSEETADLVAAMMAQNAGDRPSNYAELIARIDALPCLDGAFTAAGLPIATAPPRQVSEAAPFPVPGPVPAKRKWRVYAALVGAFLGVATVALVIANRTSRPAVYEVGSAEPLFDGRSPVGWEGQGWAVGKDIEQTGVLEGEGKVTRRLSRLAHFRVTVRLDPYRASAVELVLATTEGPPEVATQWIARLDRQGGATFGKRVGSEGDFEPLRAAVPLPAGTELKTPYLQLRYERAGGVLSVWLNDHPLGRVADRGLQTVELRMNAIGGPIRIEAADQSELIEQKPRQRP